jgi:O-antigen ligase
VHAARLIAAWLPGAVVGATALAVVPGLASPFHGPKLALLCAGAALAVAVAMLRPAAAPTGAARALGWAAATWLVTSALAALTGFAPAPAAVARDLAAAALLLGALRLGVDPGRLALAAAATGSAVAVVALLQAAGADPFAAVGWLRSTPGARLAVYGTLGNPDFLASWLVPALVLTLGAWRAEPRPLLAAAAVLMAVAIACARSLASAPSLAVAALAGAVAGRGRAHAGLLVAVAIAAVVAAAGRDPGRALAGRAYLWRVATPHLADAPLLGNGPGSFEALWPGWEAQAFLSGRAGDEDRPFSAPQDHAHADLLERALETGVAGAVALAAVVALALAAAVGAARSAADGATTAYLAALAGALAAMAARSAVDFPFARPADLALFALVAAATPRLRTATPGVKSGAARTAPPAAPAGTPRTRGTAPGARAPSR